MNVQLSVLLWHVTCTQGQSRGLFLYIHEFNSCGSQLQALLPTETVMEILAHTHEKQDRALILIQSEDEIVKRTQEPIFVVDDDQGILESFDVMLGDDYKLVMANDGNLALQLLNRHTPDLLFLDLQIPGPDGLEVLTHIRQKGLMTRVVVVTAMVQEEYQKRAEQLGVYRYLNKPLDVDEIMEIAHTATHSLQ